MIIRSRAPLRIGFAGGGTDLESYSNKFGGNVLNVTIEMYAYCTIIPTNDGRIKIISYDNKHDLDVKMTPKLELDGDNLILHRGVYNRIVKDYHGGKPLSFIMSTSNDAPIGSGLGTSSTMVVAILEAFNRWLSLGLDEYQKAKLAYEIERIDLGLAGGKQDQYASVFGGLNFMEFKKNDDAWNDPDGVGKFTNTIVNPLRLNKNVINEMECSLLLYYSGTSRKSATQQLELAKNIIEDQISNTESKNTQTIDAMRAIKANSYAMKDNILTGNMAAFAEALRKGWEEKKKTSSIVSNKDLETTINFVLSNGAEAVKVSGAGGGGFLLMYCNPMNRQKLIYALDSLPGKVYPVSFSWDGAQSWIIEG